MFDSMPARAAAAAALLLLLAGVPARAQDTAGVQGYAPGRAAAPQASLDYTFVPERTEDAIRAEMSAAQNEIREAENALARGEQQRAAAKASIDGKRQEIKAIDARIDLADKEQREADKIALEADKKIADNQRKFFEKMEDLRATNIDIAKRHQAAGQATLARLRLEQQLATQRRAAAEGQRNKPNAAAARALDAQNLDLAKRALEARKRELEARKDLADRELRLAERRLALFDAHLETRGTAGRRQ